LAPKANGPQEAQAHTLGTGGRKASRVTGILVPTPYNAGFAELRDFNAQFKISLILLLGAKRKNCNSHPGLF